MGLIYFDASVLVSLLFADVHTGAVAAWYSRVSATVILSDLANLETSAVLTRNLRAGRLTQDQFAAALLDFDAMRAGAERMSHSANDYVIAERIVRDLATKLAAADALHLASAKNAGATMATLDIRLVEAAEAYGVAVVRIE